MQIEINSFDTQMMACNPMLICKNLTACCLIALEIYSDIELAITSKGLVVVAITMPL